MTILKNRREYTNYIESKKSKNCFNCFYIRSNIKCNLCKTFFCQDCLSRNRCKFCIEKIKTKRITCYQKYSKIV